MSQLSHFITGLGRLNRRQFLVMAIITGFFLAIISIIITMVLVVILGEESAVMPVVVVDFALEIFIWLPFAFAYFIRRWHDFWMKTFVSAIFTCWLSLLYLFPGIFDIFGENSIFLEWFNILVVLIYIFYPGNKATNSYGDIPPDTGKPSRIFRYMKTGNWDNVVKTWN